MRYALTALTLLTLSPTAAWADREQWQCTDATGLFSYKQQQLFEDDGSCPPDEFWKIEEFKLFTSTGTILHRCGGTQTYKIGNINFAIDKGAFAPFDVQPSGQGSTAHGNLGFKLGNPPQPNSAVQYMICVVHAQP